MTTYQLIVSNLGTVLRTTNQAKALYEYQQYVEFSKRDYGPASGESVVLFCDDEIQYEYVGTLERNGEVE